MKLIPTTFSSLCLLAPALALLSPARGEERTLQFADPSAPGRIVLHMGLGDVTVEGTDSTDIKIESDEPIAGEEQPRSDGLRRLDSEGGYSINQSGNVITLTGNGLVFGSKHNHGAPSDNFSIKLPRQTNVKIERNGPGGTTIRNLSGDLEVRGALGGDIVLDGLSGGALIESVNGDINATFAAFPEKSPISITVVNGDVRLTAPAAARANVRFRTLRGEVLTDFPADALQTQNETSGFSGDSSSDADPTQAQMTASADRIAAGHARAKADADAKRALKNAQVDVTVDANVDAKAAPMPPIPPMPVIPSMPPIAGGKVVTGTLNGGGTDLLITTITGDITLRRGK